MTTTSRFFLTFVGLGLGLAGVACTVPGTVNDYLGIAGDTYEGTCSKLLVGYNDVTSQCTHHVIRTPAQDRAVVYSFTLANGQAYPLYLNRGRGDGNGVTTYALTSRAEDRAGGGPAGTCRETISSTSGSLDLDCTVPANPQTGAPATTVAAFSGRLVPKMYPGAPMGAGNAPATNSGVGSVR